jgi:hypothetical protein
MVSGPDLYRIGGQEYPPRRTSGAAPECRLEISPTQLQALDYFLNVLTTATADTESVPKAIAQVSPDKVQVGVGETKVTFSANPAQPWVEVNGRRIAP